VVVVAAEVVVVLAVVEHAPDGDDRGVLGGDDGVQTSGLPAGYGPPPATLSAVPNFIEPGSPWQNPFVESFGSRVRDELLWVETFDSATAGELPPPSPLQ
jgi:hypothetical protein